ncbi:hypothetical protein [Engelhardtia mirabilis]|uniref:FG-GAP repeat protein n=1 Tax=Engelhardtia mirabilis TaxID=2528011 RepID=A0A518BED1_9BACT|nr:hypothetical protein Pla133_03770 [Planctomycetes bacterium Pla133]QDU99638.1 hypothetical protein Pla86_03770 [Planctomycetes bacterium Pla86]
MQTLLAFATLLATAPLAAAQDYALDAFTNPTGQFGQSFARSVDLSGTTAVVGSFQGAWIVERNASGHWKVGDALVPLDGLTGKCFGAAVAVDGDRAVVSAYCDSSSSYQAGSVYVFERGAGGSWSQTAKLFVPSPIAEVQFGWDLDLEGTRLVVGAPQSKSPFSSAVSGAVHVFDLLPDGNWALDATLAAQNHWEGMQFGYSVALSGDRVLVGAPSFLNISHDGHVRVFDRGAGGAWSASAVLTPSDVQAGDLTGSCVALEGNTAFTGAAFHDASSFNDGAVWVWVRQSSGFWKQVQKLVTPVAPSSAQAGASLALDGDHLLIGARSEQVDGINVAGAAHLWKRDGSGKWAWAERIVSPEPEFAASAGSDLALGNGWVLLAEPDQGPGYDGRLDVVYSHAAGDVLPTNNFGQGTASCASAHTTFLPLPPLIGTDSFRVHAAGVPPLASGLLVIGSSDDPLGSDKFALGCDLHVDVLGSIALFVIPAFSDAQGLGKGKVPIPPDPVLVGLRLFAQTVWLGPPCAALPLGLSSSDGLGFEIGAP